MSNRTKTVCAILAGGEGQRLGGIDKATLLIGEQRMLDRVVEALRPQCTELALCLQEQKTWASNLGLKVLLDRPSPGLGPMGGIAAALHWAHNLSDKPDWVVTTPVDLPFLPDNLVEQLTQAKTDVVVAKSGTQCHFSVAAWRPGLIDALDERLASGPVSIRAIQAMHSVSYQTWLTDPIDPFLNVNAPEDVKIAESHLAHLLTDEIDTNGRP